ncbi:MAG: 2-oxoacid:acceptor oxidoreductase subunit alpha [Alphaproteobacteria bacterium]|nr:2-oxoacid:acceptor oxidoreductase subunit alpha [Alphaproteobacteria bacterium]
MVQNSVSIALTGSGGAGVMTAGQILLDAAAQAGFYGLMGRSLGPQIRGGESVALLRLSTAPVQSADDTFDLLVAFDWGNIERFLAELPLTPASVVIADPATGAVPASVAASGARVVMVPFTNLAANRPGSRPNMVGLGLVAALVGIPADPVLAILHRSLHRKGVEAMENASAAVAAGFAASTAAGETARLASATAQGHARWSITGNEAAGVGTLRAGVRFAAAYPITPATEILEWLAPNLPKVGGNLVQTEDELSAVVMCIGASYGGIPAVTATSGPGLSLMIEALGLAIASETPIVVVNVMRGGPSTGIPTKSEQGDLNIAVYGVHGDAPHIVIAATSISDCLHTTEWAVQVSEALQCPTIVLSDQAMGQARAIIDHPPASGIVAKRRLFEGGSETYNRYAITEDGISPMSLPGMVAGEYTAEGLAHSEGGMPSTKAEHQQAQSDKRLRKLTSYDFGDRWADIEDFGGTPTTAVITWGSVTGPVREAAMRAATEGVATRVIAVRLITPVQPERMAAALAGIKRVLVVEQNHSGQFYRFLRAFYDLPAAVQALYRPGPLPMRPHEIQVRLKAMA